MLQLPKNIVTLVLNVMDNFFDVLTANAKLKKNKMYLIVVVPKPIAKLLFFHKNLLKLKIQVFSKSKIYDATLRLRGVLLVNELINKTKIGQTVNSHLRLRELSRLSGGKRP